MARLITEAVAFLDAPMIVVTAWDGHQHSGCLAGFWTQCSIHPPRWFICISQENHTFRVAAESATLAIHFLHDDQYDLAVLFGHQTGDVTDKFQARTWRPGPGGVAILEGCDWVAGPVIERVDVGDHRGHLVEVTDAGHEHAASPQLGFLRVKHLVPGHEP